MTIIDSVTARDPRAMLDLYDNLSGKLRRAKAIASLLNTSGGATLDEDDVPSCAIVIVDFLEEAEAIAEKWHQICQAIEGRA